MSAALELLTRTLPLSLCFSAHFPLRHRSPCRCTGTIEIAEKDLLHPQNVCAEERLGGSLILAEAISENGIRRALLQNVS